MFCILICHVHNIAKLMLQSYRSDMKLMSTTESEIKSQSSTHLVFATFNFHSPSFRRQSKYSPCKGNTWIIDFGHQGQHKKTGHCRRLSARYMSTKTQKNSANVHYLRRPYFFLILHKFISFDDPWCLN